LDFALPRDAEPAAPPPVEPAVEAALPAMEDDPPGDDSLKGDSLKDDSLKGDSLEEERQRIETFLQVEEAVADEGLMAFRELPLEEDPFEENSFEEDPVEESWVEENPVEESPEEDPQEAPEPVGIFVQENEASAEAGLVILGAPPVLPFVQTEAPEAEEGEEAPVFAPEPMQEMAVEEPPAPEAAPERPDLASCPGKPYMVRRGDSFQLIAKRFGVSVRALLDANPELQPGRLMVGDVLCIPLAEPPAPAPAPAPPAREGTHRVREGESIADILLAGDVSLAAFQAANPGLRPGQQRVGDMVRMPARGARGRCGEGTPHQVAEGEDIAALAARHGVTAGMLLRANAHLLPSDFRPGQVVCVPGRG